MALTNKHYVLQQEKAALRKQFSEYLEKAKEACNQIPQEVLNGDARISSAWRDAAEETYSQIDALPAKATVEQLSARVAAQRDRLRFLIHPCFE